MGLATGGYSCTNSVATILHICLTGSQRCSACTVHTHPAVRGLCYRGYCSPFPPLFWHTRGAVCGFVYCNLKALVSLGHTLVLHASCSPHPPTPGERSCLGVPTRTGMSICNIAIGAIAACGIRLSCLLRSLPLCQTLQHVAWPVCIGCHGDAAMPY